MEEQLFGNKIVIGFMPLNGDCGEFETRTWGMDIFGESDDMDENKSILHHIGGVITADDDPMDIHSSLSGSYRMVSDGNSDSFKGTVTIDGIDYPLIGTRTLMDSYGGYVDIFINPQTLKEL